MILRMADDFRSLVEKEKGDSLEVGLIARHGVSGIPNARDREKTLEKFVGRGCVDGLMGPDLRQKLIACYSEIKMRRPTKGGICCHESRNCLRMKRLSKQEHSNTENSSPTPRMGTNSFIGGSADPPGNSDRTDEISPSETVEERRSFSRRRLVG